MPIALPIPAARYDETEQRRLHQVLENELNNRVEFFTDIEVQRNRIVLTSPNGSRFALTVDDGGVLGTVAI